MAGYNEILAGRFNRALQKFFSMKGPASVNELSTIIQAQIPLYWGVENRYLETWGRFANTTSITAVAAQLGTLNIRNPVGSNIVVIFEKAVWSNGAAAVQTSPRVIGPAPQTSAQDLGTIITNNTRFDARGQQNSQLVISNGTLANPVWGTGFDWMIGTIAVGTQADLLLTDDQEVTLLPGDGIRFSTFTLNQLVQISWMWRERLLEESERF